MQQENDKHKAVPAMAAKHATLLSDTQLLFHISLSYSIDSSQDTNDVHVPDFKDDFVFNIDPLLLLDAAQLKIGPVIGEGPHSMVYQGWWVSSFHCLKPICMHVFHGVSLN